MRWQYVAPWIPASAGMTGWEYRPILIPSFRPERSGEPEPIRWSDYGGNRIRWQYVGPWIPASAGMTGREYRAQYRFAARPVNGPRSNNRRKPRTAGCAGLIRVDKAHWSAVAHLLLKLRDPESYSTHFALPRERDHTHHAFHEVRSARAPPPWPPVGVSLSAGSTTPRRRTDCDSSVCSTCWLQPPWWPRHWDWPAWACDSLLPSKARESLRRFTSAWHLCCWAACSLPGGAVASCCGLGGCNRPQRRAARRRLPIRATRVSRLPRPPCRQTGVPRGAGRRDDARRGSGGQRRSGSRRTASVAR